MAVTRVEVYVRAWFAVVVMVAAGCSRTPRGEDSAGVARSAREVVPAIIAARPMRWARADHATLRLRDGRVLVLGGLGHPVAAEVWDPGTGLWSAAGTMVGPADESADRGRTLAVELADGRVYVYGPTGGQLWHPTERRFRGSPEPPGWAICGMHAMGALPDGRVLIIYDECDYTSDGDRHTLVWDPDHGKAEAPSAAQVAELAPRPLPGDMWVGREDSRALRLSPGLGLVTGGSEPDNHQASIDTALVELVVVPDRPRAVAPMLSARGKHALVALPGGRAAVIGGLARDGRGGRALLGDIEVLELGAPANGWRRAARLGRPRYWAAATVLGDGRVLVTGGVRAGNCRGHLHGDELFPDDEDNRRCEITAEVEIWDGR